MLASSRADVDQFIEGFDTAEYQIDISTSQGKLHLYGISVYWVTTVFSTVGFGDISPVNATERALTCILMLTGAVVFGNLLAELAEINRATQVRDRHMRHKHACVCCLLAREKVLPGAD